jgi:hypothetical protein
MPYSEFTLAKVKVDFHLEVDESHDLFSTVAKISPSLALTDFLAEGVPLATNINTEKARSEMIITPVLLEVRRQLHYEISLFSGSEFNVNPELGLSGFCDYILSGSREQIDITSPILTIVEAKKENLIGAIGQCVAAMVAAQIFNKTANNQVPMIYGAVTTGTTWRFLILEDQKVAIDSKEYYINEVDKILGILIQLSQKIIISLENQN